MSIIREIKAAWRWVFNIKDEVKLGNMFHHVNAAFIKVEVVSVNKQFITIRDYGDVPTRRVSHADFNSHYRKIS